jgi:hypothetical protein
LVRELTEESALTTRNRSTVASLPLRPNGQLLFEDNKPRQEEVL